MYRAARNTAIGLIAALVSLLCIASPAHASGPGYYYAGAAQTLPAGTTVTGVASKIWVANPYMQANSGEHTLMEIAARDSVNNNTIEMGWIKDGSGAGGPRLFVYYWKNGVAGNCYFGCTLWHDNGSNPIDVGADLATVAAGCNGTTTLNCVKQFTFQYVASACGPAAAGVFFYYDNVNFGCLENGAIPSTTAFNTAQGFGEVYYGGATVPCTDGGNGKYAISGALSASGPAYFGSFSYVPSTVTPSMTIQTNTDSGAYTALAITSSAGNRTFSAGGPGRTSTGATPGNTGSC